MDFLEVISRQKFELGAVASVNETESENEKAVVLTESDIPASMPLTNRLDKLTTDQAVWAIHNGDAWLVYLKENGVVVAHVTENGTTVTLSETEKYQAICEVLNRVWLTLTDNMKRKTLLTYQIKEWVDTLHWAVEVMPPGYERHGEIIQEEFDY